MDYTYHGFVSYRRREPDRSWVRDRFVPALERMGVTLCIDDRDFRYGPPIVLEMGRAVEQSRYTIAVVTKTYLESGFTEFENVMATHLGLERTEYRLIIVKREAGIRAPLYLRALMSVDMTDDSGDEETFAANIKKLHDQLVKPPDDD